MEAFWLKGAPRGTELTCKSWVTEAAFRMLLNNLDPAVAERPEDLVVYGGSGKAARNPDALKKIIEELKVLNDDESLLIQSGKAVGKIKSHKDAPRVLLSNSMLVPKWATWEHFRELEHKGLMMYGQMTAGSWIYIGTQGILQGTYETFVAAGKKHFGNLNGRWILSGGLGGMGGAQPLAAKIAGASFLGVDINPERIKKRLDTKYLDILAKNLDEALHIINDACKKNKPTTVGIVGNAADVYEELLKRNIKPDLVTDQTSAHDPLDGYCPLPTFEASMVMRKENPKKYAEESLKTMKRHCSAMIEFQKRGSFVFDYGNNLRGFALEAGLKNAFDYPGFVPAYVRPLFCEGKGPFRWVALSGDPEDIYKTDEAIKNLFPKNKELHAWLEGAKTHVHFQGLPARICWLGFGERHLAGLKFNEMVEKKILKAPIVIGRDHLDCGSVASPNRETESMKDGSDAVADWAVLNAFTNIAGGASWVSLHHGGGVGIGYSIHAGQVIVADGTLDAKQRIERVLYNDPLMGVYRHVDAGYDEAKTFAKQKGITV